MPDTQDLVRALAAELPAWLPAQRWFGGKDRPVRAVRPLHTTVLLDGEPLLLHLIVEVEQQDRREPYQLLIGGRRVLPEHLAGAVIASPGGLSCYEATADAELTAHLLTALADQRHVGDLRFQLEDGVSLRAGARGRPVGAEQSNTSLVYGHDYILKLFRKLAPGPNADLDRHRALRAVGCQHIAAPLASISGRLHGQPVVLGMLQEFLSDAVEGWAMAITSVRDLLAEGDLHADEAGGDFAGEAYRLGRAVATVHADLDRALGHRQAGADELAAAGERMLHRLDQVLVQVPRLTPYAPAIRESFERVRAMTGPVVIQQVHGDLHLGQVLRTVQGWLLIDFEGEPAAPLTKRILPHTPLRDVAGMLRSFDYAAHQMIVAQPANKQRTTRALEWSRRNRSAFCDGYAAVAAGLAEPDRLAVGLIGDPRRHATLLHALELDKAVYEIAYENANRPEWLSVPLASVARMTTEGEHL